jgi:DNA-binding transcriptional MocR family regulator
MSEPPLYRRLADEIHALIDKGSIRAGHRLPSLRVTARQRQISIGTALEAYVLLENRGAIEARPKSGYYVRNPKPAKARSMAGSTPGPAVPVAEKDLTQHVIDLGLDPGYFPLGSAFPERDLLPLKKLAKVSAAVGRSDAGILGRYPMGVPYPPFVQELSRKYLRTGAAIPHDEFIITSCCSEALDLALAAVTNRGDVVAVESPAYFGFLRLLATRGLKAIEVPVDSNRGLSLEALTVALDTNDVKALVVTPNFHNPTGSCMPNSRKEQLYAILCDYDIPALEDDIYADLHFGSIRPKTLKAWDREGRVLLCSSLSKTLAPGLALGWIAAGRYTAKVDELKWSNSPLFTQKIATQFLQEGYDRELRRLRANFKEQTAAVRAAVLTYFPPGTRVSEPAGGFVLWLELPPQVDSLQLRADALREKISTAPGPIFSARGEFRNYLRINCGLKWTGSFEKAVKTLGRLASSQGSAPRVSKGTIGSVDRSRPVVDAGVGPLF